MSARVLVHETIIDPAFHDLDPMSVVWHGHHFRYFEVARTELLRRIDYDYPNMKDAGYAWPIIECHCRYTKPILYGKKIAVTATMVEFENRMKILYEITDVASGARLCKGSTTQVAVDLALQEACFVTPENFRQRVVKSLQDQAT